MMKLKRPVAALLAAVLLLGLLSGCHRRTAFPSGWPWAAFRPRWTRPWPPLMRKRPWSAICLKIL